MEEQDLLKDLMESRPNSPALKGELLLLRVETGYEIKTLRKEMNQRFDRIDQRFEGVDQRFKGVDQQFKEVNQQLKEIKKMLSAVCQQVATLVERSMER